MYYTFKVVSPYEDFYFNIRHDNTLFLIEIDNPMSSTYNLIKSFFIKELEFKNYVIGFEVLLENIWLKSSYISKSKITFNILFENNETYFYINYRDKIVIPKHLREIIYDLLISKKLLVDIESFQNIIKTKFGNYKKK